MQMMDSGWGSFLKYKLSTDTRSFEQVEKALHDSGIQDYHASPLLQRPKSSTAFTRSMGYLTRVCAASIPFPPDSPNASWDEDGKAVTGERNPNYSLKVESVKSKDMPEEEVAYRINISDRRSKDENMAHVLTATYRPNFPVNVLPGDQPAWDKFGEDIAKLVKDAYSKFFSNYDDTDIRDIVVKELASLSAVNVLGKTTNFIARDTDKKKNAARAEKLVQFIHDCGHECTLLGLNGSELTRDAIVTELRASIMSQLQECEDDLDEKLGTKTKVRQRGVQQRERMKNTAETNVDSVMALAEYHAEVLGIMAEGIKERAATIKAKAAEFLTRDFGTGVPSKAGQASNQVVSDLEKKIATLEAELQRMKSFQGLEITPHPVTTPAQADESVAVIPPAEVVATGADPFAV